MRRLANTFFYIIILFFCKLSFIYANCSITGADNLIFGNYNTLDTTDTISQYNISINCKGSKSFTVKLSSGNSGNFSQRKLYSVNSYNLNYNIYLDSNFSSIWGDGTNSTVFYSGSIRGTQVITGYGMIPARQNVAFGSYSDSIIVTLEF